MEDRSVERFPDGLASALRLAQGAPLTIDILLRAAQPFGLHRGATFVEFVGYVERETGTEVQQVTSTCLTTEESK